MMDFKTIAAWLSSALVSIIVFLFVQINGKVSSLEKKINLVENMSISTKGRMNYLEDFSKEVKQDVEGLKDEIRSYRPKKGI